MLNLNRRLETYLSRVKLLEEENGMLANELKVLRHSNQGTLTRRRGLEEELRQARMEVDATWRERVLTEVEVEKLTEEIQALELQRQREAEAKMLAKTKMEQSRKELEEEQRAQIWLREKVNQLEHEMRFLIQTHEEDVAHLEATLTNSRAEMLPSLIQRSKQTPDLLKMGQEFSQRATRAWQEASEAYQSQLAQLEESLDQARSRLSQVCQEKRESQLKLQTLEKEIASAQDVRQHLEKTVARRREEHFQEIQELGERLEELEVEKGELGHQIDHLLQENHSLMQLKMSLGLEVATYRALLDGESLGRDAALLNKPRHISFRDAVQSPHGVKKNYPTQLSASLKTTYPSPIQGRAGSSIPATQALSKRSAALRETPQISNKPVMSATPESTYPKIVQNGAAENFRPEEVHEKVTYAEPLSPPNEQEAPAKMSEEEDKTEVEAVIESVVTHTTELGLSREPPLNEKPGSHQLTTSNPVLSDVGMTELTCHFSDELVKDVASQEETEEEKVQHPRAQADASAEAEHVEDETSDSETEAMLEPTFESRPSSPEFECEPLESVFNQVAVNKTDESFSKVDAVVMRQESSSSTMEANERGDEDKLYPDGEEMDTWDSVIERKVSERIDDGLKNEGNKQHAEPEEDISAKEPEEKSKDDQVDDIASQGDDGHHTILELEHVTPSDKEEEGDEEDSQNVSVSWKTELESDSYAQDNTVADTRPLIRYKSDDTDGNTQASHNEESESSEGKQEKKVEEAGSGTWSDGKPKTFGTMEDLCEEVEEEIVDDDFNLGYMQVEDKDEAIEYGMQATETEKVEEVVISGTEGHSEEEITELTRPNVSSNVDYDVELETDRLVEQELENLSTDTYTAYFAHEQVRGDKLEQRSIKEMNEQETTEDTSTCEPEISVNYTSELSIAAVDESLERQLFNAPSVETDFPTTLTEETVKGQEEAEKPAGGSFSESEISRDSESEKFTTITGHAPERQLFSIPFAEMHSANTLTKEVDYEQKETEKAIVDTDSCKPEISVNHEHIFYTMSADESLESQFPCDAHVGTHSTNTLTDKNIQHKDQGAVDNSDRREEDEHNMMSPAEGLEQAGLKDFLSRSDMEDIQDPSSGLLVAAEQNPLQDVEGHTEATDAILEDRVDVSQENPIEDSEDFHKIPEDKETTEGEYQEYTTKESEISDQNECELKNNNMSELSDDDIIIHQDEPVEDSPNSALNENDIFIVKDVADSSLQGHFTSDGKNDFWVSSMETGATYLPGKACNEAAEQTNHNQGFADKDWAYLQNPKVVNGNSKLDIDPSGLHPMREEEQKNREVKKVFCRNVVEGEMVHSEESDVEAESWSSGEEQA